MLKYSVLILCLSGYCLAGLVGVKKRNVSIGQQKANNDDAAAQDQTNSDEMMLMSTLTLPSNATSIRADITDNFSCENKAYGYYADVENDCQIFHVCLPVTYADGKENTFRWSFICPEETIFSQESFTCMRPDDMVSTCEESFKYYNLNDNFGNVEQESEKEPIEMPAEPEAEEPAMKPVSQTPVKPNRRKPSNSYVNSQKKQPSNSYPLRKVAQAQSNINSNTDADEMNKIKETLVPLEEAKEKEKLPIEEEIKPIVQKFSRRPAGTSSNSFKDKMQNTKTQTVNPIRSDLYNQKRHRPSLKKPIAEEAMQPEEVQPAKEVQSIASQIPVERVPEIAAEPEKDDTVNGAESFSPVELELSNTDSENNVAKRPIKSEEVESSKVNEEPQVLEAFEEIPAVITEIVEPIAQSSDEQSHKENEPIPAQTQAEEDPQANEDVSQSQNNQEPQETFSVEGPRPIEDKVVAAEEPQVITEEHQAPFEEVYQNQEPQEVGEVPEHFVEKLPVAEESQSVEKESEDVSTPQEPEKIDGELENSENFAASSYIPAEQDVEPIKVEIPTAEHTEVEEDAQLPTKMQASAEELPEKVESPVEFYDTNKESIVEDEFKPVMEFETGQEIESSQEPEQPEENKLQADEGSLNNEMIQVQPVKNIPEAIPEKQQPAENILPENGDTATDSENEASVYVEPTIFEQNSGEASAGQSVEEMEEERPHEAPETMPATEEMSENNPIVQQMFEETIDEDKKQTIGGFKPVDPVMAAEAEQLIADFINTLRNNEFVNEEPGMPMHVPMIEENVPESSENGLATVVEDDNNETVQEDNNNQEDSLTTDEEDKKESGQKVNDSQEQIDEVKEEEQSGEILPQLSAAETKDEESEDVRPVEVEIKPEDVAQVEESQESQESNVKVSDEEPHQVEAQQNPSPVVVMPQESYQIPVQVITSPMEEMPKPQVNAHIKPLSIDDIVELVKERLDHMPKDKMETPMQLEHVLSGAQALNEEHEKADEILQADSDKTPETLQSEEEPILPIYHRAPDGANEQALIDAEVATAAEDAAAAAEPSVFQENASRFYRLRNMLSPKVDVRKRRFLFRSDAS